MVFLWMHDFYSHNRTRKNPAITVRKWDLIKFFQKQKREQKNCRMIATKFC